MLSDIRDVVATLGARLRAAQDQQRAHDQELSRAQKEAERQQALAEEQAQKAEALEQECKNKSAYIQCIQRDCEQVVTAKEEWLQVMRSFKESEEKV